MTTQTNEHTKTRYTPAENLACAIFAKFFHGAPDTVYGAYIAKMFPGSRSAGSFAVRIGEFKDPEKPPYIEDVLRYAMETDVKILLPRTLVSGESNSQLEGLAEALQMAQGLENLAHALKEKLS